jgi:hypothetical protein
MSSRELQSFTWFDAIRHQIQGKHAMMMIGAPCRLFASSLVEISDQVVEAEADSKHIV